MNQKKCDRKQSSSTLNLICSFNSSKPCLKVDRMTQNSLMNPSTLTELTWSQVKSGEKFSKKLRARDAPALRTDVRETKREKKSKQLRIRTKWPAGSIRGINRDTKHRRKRRVKEKHAHEMCHSPSRGMKKQSVTELRLWASSRVTQLWMDTHTHTRGLRVNRV